ncbi:MAG TPA: hypothetical protein VM074_12430 [Solimonas sp.]|nr:hypothetical protein [Solimonas sp.]
MNPIPKFAVTLFSAAVLVLALGGCNKREEPAKTQSDVADAQADGAKKIEAERHDAANDAIKAQEDVYKADAELAHQSAQGNREVAIAEAEAAHKVMTERCEAMSGDARTACKKQADVDLLDAKARAESIARAADPKS